jgi:hypothetical protein
MRRASWLFLPAAAVLTLTFALPARSLAQAQDDATKFRNRETAVWESVKNKELESIRKVFDNDYVAVYEDGIVDRSGEVAGMAKMTLRSYKLSDFRIHRVDALNVVVAYKAQVEGDMNGQGMSGAYNALSVWHRNGNAWSVQAHSDVKAK